MEKFSSGCAVLLLFFALFSTSNSGLASSQWVSADNPNNLEEMVPMNSKLFEKYLAHFPQDTQVSVALIQKGSVTYYGMVKKGGSLAAIENFDKVFEIGSISKVFTATLLADLVNQGRISLDQHIQEQLDFELKTDSIITYKQLANHTSGLPAFPSTIYWKVFFGITDNPFSRYSVDDLRYELKHKLKLKSQPGESYRYSNLAYGLLGYLLTRIEGSSYETMLQKRIFTKYGMKHSSTIWRELSDRLVPGLDKKGRRAQNWDFLAIEGAGAVLSTVEDLSKFAMAQFDRRNKELLLTQQQTFAIADSVPLGENKFKMGVGLGWHILTGKSGAKWHWHNGGTKGYHSSMVLDLNSETGVIILSNVSVYNKHMLAIENLLFELMESIERID